MKDIFDINAFLNDDDPAKPLEGAPPLAEGDLVITDLDPFQRKLCHLIYKIHQDVKVVQKTMDDLRTRFNEVKTGQVEVDASARDNLLAEISAKYESYAATKKNLEGYMQAAENFLTALVASSILAAKEELPKYGAVLKGDGKVVTNLPPPPSEDWDSDSLPPYTLAQIVAMLIAGQPGDCGDPKCEVCGVGCEKGPSGTNSEPPTEEKKKRKWRFRKQP